MTDGPPTTAPRTGADRRGLRRTAIAMLVVGIAVMVAFDRWYTLLAGVVLLLGFVGLGVFLVADPDGFLDHDRPDETSERTTGPTGS